MKLILITSLFFFLPLNCLAQESIHWLINQDSNTNCDYLKKGIFLNKETDCKITEGYSIEFLEDYVLEKVDNGKYFVKSKLNFISDCNYELIIEESNIEAYNSLIGHKVYGEILETATSDKLVKVKVKSGDKTLIVFFYKIKD